MKRFLPLLALFLCLFCFSASAEPREMPDFTVQTLNGSFSLSETLQEKKMVLINFFATWCGPCKMEFPFMQQAYEQYADSVAVLALSVEENDTPSVLRSYAEDLGLTFDVGSDTDSSLASKFLTGSIPVTVVVDRFGQIVLEEVGARSSADDFLNLFDFFTADSYTKSVSLNGFPGPRANVEGENQETLLAALGNDIRLTYRNPENPFVWPMKAVQDGERLVLEPSGPFALGTRSELSVLANATEGDALSFELKTASTDGINLLTVEIDGTEVFVLGGSTDWTRYALPLPEGEHTVTFIYTVQMLVPQTESVQLDSFCLLSGEEAAQALAANPAFPVSEAFHFSVNTPGASLLSFEDPFNTLSLLFGNTDCYLVEGQTAVIDLGLPEDMNPHKVILYSPNDNLIATPAEIFSGQSYTFEVALPEDSDSTNSIASVVLYGSIEDALQDHPFHSLTLFPGEKAIQALITYLSNYGFTLSLNP